MVDVWREWISTFCSVKHDVVKLNLCSSSKPKGKLISGVPESCSCMDNCVKQNHFACLLNAQRITTHRTREACFSNV